MIPRSQAWGFDEFVVVAAVRYCLDRKDGSPSMCVEWLAENWPLFSDNTRAVIQRDVENTLHVAREWKSRMFEVQEWEKVRALWRQETHA